MVKPLYDNALIKKKGRSNELEKSQGGIFMPSDAMKEQFSRGVVVDVGCGYLKGAELVELQINVGDEVIYRLGSEIKVGKDDDGNELFLVSEGAMLGVENKE